MSSEHGTPPASSSGQAADAAQPLPFAAVLAGLWRQQQTGRLDVVADGIQTTIYLRAGVVVFAARGSVGNAFGQMLLDAGLIDSAQFSQAVEQLTEVVFDNEQQQLCETMVELGFTTAEKLLNTLRAQVRQVVARCFTATQLQGKFHEGVDQLQDIADFSSPPEQLWMAGVRMTHPQRLDQFLRPYGSVYPSLTDTAEQTARRFDLAGSEVTFLRAFTGGQSIRQLRDYSVLDPIHAAQVLSGLLLGRGVQLSREPVAPPAPVQTIAPADTPPSAPMSGGGRTANEAPAKQAPKGPLVRRSTGARKVPAKEDRLGVTGKMMAMVDRFRHTPLRGSPVHDPPEQTPDAGKVTAATALEAEQSFERGIEAYRAQRWDQALEAFEDAAKLNPDGPEYRLWAAWLSYRSSTGRARRKAADQAQREAARVYAKQGKSPLANLVLGHLAAGQGRTERARRHLLVAAEHDTQALLQADDELRALAPSGPQRRGGTR